MNDGFMHWRENYGKHILWPLYSNYVTHLLLYAYLSRTFLLLILNFYLLYTGTKLSLFFYTLNGSLAAIGAWPMYQLLPAIATVLQFVANNKYSSILYLVACNRNYVIFSSTKENLLLLVACNENYITVLCVDCNIINTTMYYI